MSVKLRFRRMGRKKLPVYGLVATDSRSPRDGRFIEDLGRYEPVADPAVVRLDADRIVYWLSQGAQPSDTVRNLLQKEGVLLRWALTRRGEEAGAIEQAVTEFRERQQAKAGPTTKMTPAQRRAEALAAERKAAAERAAELEKERKEREAALERERQEAEAAERAEREAAAAAAGGAADEGTTETTAEDPALSGEAVEQTSSQADAGSGSEAAETAVETAEAEAADGNAAVAATSAADVPESGPASAGDQPVVGTESVEAAADAVEAKTDEEREDGAEIGVAEAAKEAGSAEDDKTA